MMLVCIIIYSLAALGSRQLLIFRRIPDAEVPSFDKQTWNRRKYASGSDADELNAFRRKVRGF